MARPVVPHCDNCPNLYKVDSGWWSVSSFVPNGYHIRYCRLLPKRIPGKVARTSPAWCPRRHVAKTKEVL